MSDVALPPKGASASGRNTVVTPGGGLDIVYVLTLMQVAFLLLAALGEVILMGGNVVYLLMPVVKSALLLLFATEALRQRRWALRALVVLAWITLAGYQLQFLIGFFPAVDFTVNLVGLMTNVALPIAVILLCRPHLLAIKQARRAAREAARAVVSARALPLPQDPYNQPTVPIPVPPRAPVAHVPPGVPMPAGVAVVYPPVTHGPPVPPAPVSPVPPTSPVSPVRPEVAR